MVRALTRSDQQRLDAFRRAEKYSPGTIGHRVASQQATGYEPGTIGHRRAMEKYSGYKQGTLGYNRVFGGNG